MEIRVTQKKREDFATLLTHSPGGHNGPAERAGSLEIFIPGLSHLDADRTTWYHFLLLSHALSQETEPQLEQPRLHSAPASGAGDGPAPRRRWILILLNESNKEVWLHPLLYLNPKQLLIITIYLSNLLLIKTLLEQ